MGAAASSSSSSKKYDVFISFRGDDTRRTFTSHLHTALCLRGIETFIDYELPKGGDISQSLGEAIQNSSISVVVFSGRYATSKWCLNELIEILHCKQHQKQYVIPIFYEVDPSDVRHQRGSYKKAFEEHLKKNPDKVDEWRRALLETGKLAGWHSSNYRDDAELIDNIVCDIIKKLNHGPPRSVLADIVGIDENLDHIELLLEGFSTIGIWGMSGIGKTTMARVVYTKLCSQFDSCCFLENLREKQVNHGLEYIRDQLFNELSKDTSLERLNRKKVLIVLDDVNNTSQLDYLKREAPPLGPGSKVIITSINKHVLDGRVDKIHKAKALSYHDSLKLFNLKAFRKNGYKSEYKELVERAVAYAKGIPLVLTILGSFLHSKTVKEWESALRKVQMSSHQDIYPVLKVSYDGLDDEEKEIFLDIASFFKGESREFVIAVLDGCGFHTSIGLRTLMDKALISIDRHMVQMHDLIQTMAFKIVRQQCKNPEGRSRLWNPDEIYDVLKRNLGTDAIEGIRLDLSQIRDLQLSVDTFRKMTKLRILIFYSPWHKRSGIVNLPSGLESFSNSLSYLRWDNFPSNTLPLPFCAEKLVKLCMPNSHLEKLWDGVQKLVNLREINLGESKQLTELPDFCSAQNLERIDLFACESLCHIDPSILSLPRLRYLELSYCKKLESLKMESQSKSLSRLNISGCSSLKEFSFSSDKVTYLQIDYTGVEILDFSIGHMEKLQRLELDSAPLKILPINEICCMRSLQQLFLDYCGGIIDKSKLYTLFDALLSLTSVSVRGACKLTELPNNVKHLSRLQYLCVSICKSLQSIPELPPSIEELHAFKCSSLKTLQLTSHTESSLLPDEIKLGSTLCSPVNYLINLRQLILGGCKQLYELPEFVDSLSSLSSLDLNGSNVEILPCSVKHLSNLKYIYLSNCRRLRSLPELPPFIKHVDANGCISLEIVSPSITSAPELRFLFLNDCLKLENSSLSCVMESAYFSLKRSVYTKRRGAICFPGRNVPMWFSFNQGIEASNYITIELPATTNNLVGFIFCTVLSHHPPGHLQCQLYYDGKQRTCSKFHMTMNNMDSHNVFLWCDPDTFINFHKATDGHNMNYRPKVSFEFFVAKHREKFVDGVIEACGVCPIYAGEYNNFIQQMKLLDSNLGAQKETCQNVDENSFHGILKNVSVSLKQGKWGNFEGSIIPEWFTYRSLTINHAELQVSVRLAPNFDNLKGFMFCFVIPHFSLKERDQCHSTCECIFFDRNDSLRGAGFRFYLEGPTGWPLTGWHYAMVKLNSDNVFLWYDPLYCERILQKLRKRVLRDDAELQFGFMFGHGLMGECGFKFGHSLIDELGFKADNCLIKECGVRLIYDSDYTNFLQQNKLKVSIPTKRHRNIDDDQHQLPPTKKLKESSIIQSIPLISCSNTSHDVNELLLMLSELNLEPTKNHIHQD